MKSVKFAGKRLARGGEMLQDRERHRGARARGGGIGGHDSWDSDRTPPESGARRAWRHAKGTKATNGSGEEEVQHQVRGLLLQAEHAVRPEPRRALPDVPPGRTGPQAAAPARVRLPYRAHPCG